MSAQTGRTCVLWLPVKDAERAVSEGFAEYAPSVYFPLLHDLARVAFRNASDAVKFR